MALDNNLLAGVIEGFYGTPWSLTERLELFDWMSRWGLNTYLYAPKDDLKHRVLWREPYSFTELESLSQLSHASKTSDIRFIFALSPGLDIRYHDDGELNHLRIRFDQMLKIGCRDFGLFFDDIPERMDSESKQRWGSFASAQCHVANSVFSWLHERNPEARFLFCPTPYCGRMAEREFGGQDYLSILGRELSPGIDILWTGPEIISAEITLAHIQSVRATLGRKPFIWDNLHANDYDGRRFYCGPYAGREPELRNEVSGILCNPNSEFPLNYVPLRTFAKFVHSQFTWEPRNAYLSAMQEWWPRFETVGQPLRSDNFILFGDCHYLPHQLGPEAEHLYRSARSLLAASPRVWGDQSAVFLRQAAALREFCARLSELRDRALFHALSRRIWDLREELDLLERFVEFKSRSPDAIFASDFHLAGTYRGGIVAQLQRLLQQRPDGTLSPSGTHEPSLPTP